MRPVTLDYRRPSTSSVRPWKRWRAVSIPIGVGAGVAGLAVLWLDRPKPGERREISAHTDIRVFGTALDAFKIDTGRYPTAAEGLGALTNQPPGLTGWNGPYSKVLSSSDPWGQPYVYHAPKAPGGRFVVVSVGPDGKEGTADDVR